MPTVWTSAPRRRTNPGRGGSECPIAKSSRREVLGSGSTLRGIVQGKSGRLKTNTVELAVRYVWNMASNYSPLTKGGYRGVPGRGDPAGLGRKITPPTPPSQGGDEFAISTATVGYS